MDQERNDSRQNPSISRGHNGQNSRRDDPFDNKDITNRRKCPDCDGRLSKESTKSKSRVWKKVMWFTRRSKVSKNDICHCQTGDAFIINSNVEDRHSNSWSFSRSASRKFRISSRKRQCKSESSKKSLYVQGRQEEACSSHESSLSTSQRVSICSSGASSPTATGSFCDFGASSHAGGRGSKRHKNTFVLTEIAREINPPVWNDDLKLSGFNHKPKLLTKSSSTVSHLSRQFVSPTTGNVRRSKSFPGSQSHMSPPKRRFTSTPNTTFVTSSPPVKQKCYGLRRTATYCGKLNTEFPKLCMKKSKSVNSGELTKHGKSTSLGEIRDQSGSVVGIVHFYKSPKRLARKVGSFNFEVKKDCVFEEEDCQCPAVDETSSDASLQSSTTCLSTDSTISDTQHDVGIDVVLNNVNQGCSSSMTTLAAVTENVESIEEISQCEPSSMTADKSFSSTLLSKGEMTDISNLQSVSKTSEVLQGDSASSNDYCEQNLLTELHVPSSVAAQQSSENVECVDCGGTRDYHHGNLSDPELHPLLASSAEQTSEDVDLTCCHNNHMSNDSHVCGHCNTNHLTEPPSSERTSEDVELPYEYGDSVSGDCNGNQPSTEHESLETLEDFELKTEDEIVSNESEHPTNDPGEVQVLEQLDNLSAPGEDDFVFCNDAKTNHNCPYSVCEEDLSSESFDNQFSAVATPIVSNERFQSHVHSNMITNTEAKLNSPTISINSASDPIDLYKGSEPNVSCENWRNLPEPVMAREELKIRGHSSVNTSLEVLQSSKTSDYISLFDESFSETDVPIHTWKTSESDLKSDEVGLPVPGETFKRRTELMLSWFEEFNDEQRNIILKKILNRCELPQMHLLSVAMENNLHKTCPPNCQDMLVWLPYTVTLKILMYLDPVSLCRCSQVNRAWNELTDSSLLWQRLTRSPDYQLSEASSKRQYQKFTQANGEIHWKKIFAERFLLQRNWLNGKYKLRTFEGHNQGIACVQFDDTRIVSGSSDKTIKLWDISNTPSELMLTLEGHSGTVRCLDLNGNRLVSGSTDRTIKVWDLSFASYWAGASCKVTMVGHLHTVRCLQADEKKLVSGSYDKTVKVWDLKNGECQLTLRGHTAAVLCVQFDDQKIVSGSYDKKIKVWDLKEGTCLMTLDGHQDAVTCLNLTHDGMKIITGSLDYSLKFWDLSTGKCYGTLDWITSEGHTAVVRCLQVDSWRIVSGGDDKTLKVWELATGQRLLTLRYHSDGVTCMQFNDFAIVSGSYDRTVKLWDFTPKHPYLEAVT